MKLTFDANALTVEREPGDPSYPTQSQSSWGTPESRLLYHIQKQLNADGSDLIKKRMWKDGHLVSDEQQYLRPRSRNSPGLQVCIWNGSWQVYDAARRLMEDGKVVLLVDRDIWKQKEVKS